MDVISISLQPHVVIFESVGITNENEYEDNVRTLTLLGSVCSTSQVIDKARSARRT